MRLELLGRVVWHDGSPAEEEHVEKYLPEVIAIIVETAARLRSKSVS